MWTRFFARLDELFAAVAYAEAGEFDTAREIDYGRER